VIPRGASVGARQPHVPAPVPVPPVNSLLLHFDSSQLDEVSQEVFTGGSPTYAAGVFGNAARTTSEFAGAVAGAWSEALSIGTQPFTIEFRARFYELYEDTGGILIAKNYWASEPSGSAFALDWQVSVGPGYIDLSWSDLGGAGSPESVNVAIASSGAWRAFAITDDGVNLRFYVNGARVYEGGSVQLSGTIPAVSGARVSLYKALPGFYGSVPFWGWSRVFSGQVDELRLTLGEALYTGASYTLATQPFSL
jgi:hypothetical protein